MNIKKIILFIIIICKNLVALGETKLELNFHKEEMRNLIYKIRQDGKDKVIITQNAVEIYFDDENLNKKFFDSVDSAAQESLVFGYGGYNKKTIDSEKIPKLKKLIKLKELNKPIFLVNYADGNENKNEIKLFGEKYNFVAEAVESIQANTIFSSINKRTLGDVTHIKDGKNFLYLLNPEKFKNIKSYFKALSKTSFDILIIEPSINGKFFSKEQIEKLKVRKDGTKRLVIAYFSIGEAENYRGYWLESWNQKKPEWIVEENPNWKGNYVIKYWSSEWKEIIKNYQEKLNEINVDGYYLDTIDTYVYFKGE
ncbi:MAG: endo alpha-1,4 polygalactosaminidase [Cetobacterium sp.]